MGASCGVDGRYRHLKEVRHQGLWEASLQAGMTLHGAAEETVSCVPQEILHHLSAGKTVKGDCWLYPDLQPLQRHAAYPYQSAEQDPLDHWSEFVFALVWRSLRIFCVSLTP